MKKIIRTTTSSFSIKIFCVALTNNELILKLGDVPINVEKGGAALLALSG